MKSMLQGAPTRPLTTIQKTCPAEAEPGDIVAVEHIPPAVRPAPKHTAKHFRKNLLKLPLVRLHNLKACLAPAHSLRVHSESHIRMNSSKTLG